MVTNLAKKKKELELKRSLINAVCTCTTIIGHTFQEKQLLGVYWKCLYAGGYGKLRLILAPVLPKKVVLEQQLRQVFIIVYQRVR